MMRYLRNRNIYLFFYICFIPLFIASCKEGEDVSEYTMSVYSSSPGVINTVKKAYQMTDLKFTPVNNIAYNVGTYYANNTYQGMIYSSVRELDLYAGIDVSLHTIMTAIHNPHSKIYTEKVNEPPYYGTLACCAYYGTHCSSFVSYALGLPYVYYSYDFPKSDEMEEINFSDPDVIHVGDILWTGGNTGGHVALITGLSKSESGHVNALEISESWPTGCVREIVLLGQFLHLMQTKFTKIFRYKGIDSNIEYQSFAEFVPVSGEQYVPFTYNDDLCVDKGDKSCYLEGEPVAINLMHDADRLEIIKDNELYQEIEIKDHLDIYMESLPFGDYKACVYSGGIKSDFTYWKMVKATTEVDREKFIVYFDSPNAVPHKIRLADKTGLRAAGTLNRLLTEDEKAQGYAVLEKDQLNDAYPYIHLSYQTEYGNIIDKPLQWIK